MSSTQPKGLRRKGGSGSLSRLALLEQCAQNGSLSLSKIEECIAQAAIVDKTQACTINFDNSLFRLPPATVPQERSSTEHT